MTANEPQRRNPAAAQQAMIRLRTLVDLFDDGDLAAGARLLDEGSRASLRQALATKSADEPQARTLDDRLALVTEMTAAERHTLLGFVAATDPAGFDAAYTAWQQTRKRPDEESQS